MVASVLTITLASAANAGSDYDGYMTLDGGAYLTTPSFSNGNGDIDVIFYAAANKWSSGTQTVLAHWPDNSARKAVRVQFTNGHLQLIVKDKSGNGHVYSAWESSLDLTNGKGSWFRVTLDVSKNNKSEAKFYTSSQKIDTGPAKVNWGSAVRTDSSSKITLRDKVGKWTIGAAEGGSVDRFKGDLGYVGFWRNGWSTNGGKQTITLDMRSPRQADGTRTNWKENGHTWTVKGSNSSWDYTEPSSGGGGGGGTTTTTSSPTTTSTSTTSTSTTSTTSAPNNEKPNARTDNYTITEGSTVVITKSKLLSNDTDPEGDALTVKSVSSPSEDGVAVTPDGNKWNYVAPSNAGGTVDTITYRIEDTAGNTDAGTIRITIEKDDNSGSYDVTIRPGDNFEQIVNNKPSGTSFYVKAGKYRLHEIKPKDGMTFVAESGAIMSGAKKLTQFGQSGGLWFASGQSQGSGNKSPGSEWGNCEGSYSACVYPEQLFINGQLLWQVKSKSSVGPGKWYFDYGADKIWFADNPTGKTVETSVAGNAFYGNADDVHIEGFVIERYATPGRQGAIQGRTGRTGNAGSGWTVRDNTIRDNHGYGVKVESGMDVINNVIKNMGQMGIGGAYANNVLIKNNEIVNNCISGFQCFGFGGGAVKINNMTNVTLKGNYVHDNPGHGLHLDQESVNVIYEDNIVRNNEGNGIHHETGDGAIIRNNLVEGNGFRSDGSKNFGIMVLSSANVEVYGNTLRGNANGIIGRQDRRTDIMKMRNLWVHHNDITLDGSARVGLAIDGISDTSYFTSKNNRFTDNEYTFDYGNNSFKPFKWISGSVSVSKWKDVGMDRGGSFTWL
ncbi:MAG: cadherin-like domain-containing protein [Acidimicrobiia bacterium]|nr:cadherin-like domain-containing protein [Acidimicrobiia bacterium]